MIQGIKMKLSGAKVSPNILLLSGIVDRLNLLLWSKTKDGLKGINKPKSILDEYINKESDISAFASGKEFEKERQRLIAKQKGGNFMATELGKAYVQIIPSAKGISGSIQKTLSPEATKAGKKAGTGIAEA